MCLFSAGGVRLDEVRSGHSEKALWRSWNVRRAFGHRRVRSWQNWGVGDTWAHGWSSPSVGGPGPSRCSLIRIGEGVWHGAWVFGPETDGRCQRAVSGNPGGSLEEWPGKAGGLPGGAGPEWK